MLADDVACNSRNRFPATVYANSGRGMDLYGDGIEVDYRGYEVTVESFLRLLTGEWLLAFGQQRQGGCVKLIEFD